MSDLSASSARVNLPDWLADPGLHRLWGVVHDRLEQRGNDWRGRATVDVSSPAERRALSSLLGRALAGTSVVIDVGGLDRLTANAGGIVAVVEQAVGPVRDRRSAREVARAARDAPVVAAAAALPPAPWTAEWLAFVRRVGPSVNDAVIAGRLLTRLLADHEPVSRQDLAVGATGDAHALDEGTALCSLVLRGLSLAVGVPPPDNAATRRELWDAVGVVLDAVSSTCLVVALPVREGRLARRLDDGQPLHLTGRDLRDELIVAAGATVFVCENPRVLEAVVDAGLALPVVCANGNPNLVVVDVLTALRRGGARLLYHGDFDWPGLAIANRLVTAVGVEPWLMRAQDYESAAGGSQLVLRGQRVDASWDPTLARVMVDRGVAVHEEAVLPQLLSALERAPAE